MKRPRHAILLGMALVALAGAQLALAQDQDAPLVGGALSFAEYLIWVVYGAALGALGGILGGYLVERRGGITPGSRHGALVGALAGFVLPSYVGLFILGIVCGAIGPLVVRGIYGRERPAPIVEEEQP